MTTLPTSSSHERRKFPRFYIHSRMTMAIEDTSLKESIGLGEPGDRLVGPTREGDEAVGRPGDGEGEILGVIVGIDSVEVFERDGHRSALDDRQVEVAGDGGRHVADLGAEVGADLHGELAILHVARNGPGAANVDQVLDHDISLEGAVDFGLVGLDRAEAASALVHEKRLGRHVAFNVSVDLHLATIANLAL